MIEEGIRTKLIATSAVSALVGATSPAASIWVVQMPQKPKLPGVVITRLTATRDYHMQGQSGTVPSTFQIDSIATKASAALGLSDAVRGALSAFKGAVGTECFRGCYLINERVVQDDNTELFRVIQTWNIWFEES